MFPDSCPWCYNQAGRCESFQQMRTSFLDTAPSCDLVALRLPIQMDYFVGKTAQRDDSK